MAHRSLWRLFARLTIVTALLATPLAVSPAYAASPTVSSSAWRRDCVNTALTGCQNVGGWKTGAVTMVCFVDGSEATGKYRSKRWFYLVQGKTKGYAHSSWVSNQVKVPACSTHAGVSAMTWAAEHVGIEEPTPGEAQALDIRDRRWTGWCSKFAQAAYRFSAAKRMPKGAGTKTAKNMYFKYRDALRVVKPMSTEPLVGSLVFWPNLSEGGHVAIYAGNGHVLTTVGAPGTTPKKIARKKITDYRGNASGWVSWADA